MRSWDGLEARIGDVAAMASTSLPSSSCFPVSSVVEEPRAIAQAITGRFALKLQPAGHGDMSESFYPGVENEDVEKIKENADFEVSEVHISI
jgi:hypothetical protein